MVMTMALLSERKNRHPHLSLASLLALEWMSLVKGPAAGFFGAA